VPKRQNLKRTLGNSIKNEVVDPRKMRATQPTYASSAFGNADAGLGREDAENAREFGSYRARRRRPVLRPPRSGFLDLGLCPR
jgi:hypothetical protein